MNKIVRAQFDLKGYEDPQVEFPPSCVDSSQYEELSTLVRKFLRGERKVRFVPVYEIDSEIDPEKAIDEIPPNRLEGFELSDAHAVLSRGRERFKEIRRKEREKAEMVKSQEGKPPLGGASGGPEGPQEPQKAAKGPEGPQKPE